MDGEGSSPERPSVKVTYLDRQKRKRTITESSDDPSHTNSATTDTAAEDSATTARQVKDVTKVSSMKAPDSRGPKKLEVYLPGPAPKRVRRDSDESTKSAVSAKSKKSSHVRSASSISLSRTAQQVAASASTPTSTKKPASVAGTKPASSRRPASPDTEMDDGASIADSVVSTGKIRRTELERIEYFKNEPECGKLEEHRAECTRCGKFVSLGKKQKYTVRPWEIHRLRCDQKQPKSPSGHLDTNADEELDDASDKSKPTRAPLRTAEDRKAALEADPRISVVRPHEVLCRNCGRWIRLSNSQVYKDYNWRTHTLGCDAAVPSKRVATATRKLQLVNDSQVKSFTTHEVVCALCDAVVTSNGEGDYNVIHWEDHKTTCTRPLRGAPTKSNKTSTDPPLLEVSTVPFPGRPPPSSASTSTEGTLIVSDTKNNSQVHGIKRLREDDDVVDTPPDSPDARPSNRPRTETYEPPVKEAPSPAGWLMLPFKAFVRGFKESLKRA
ncbi:hypothetical protein LshimejAT787_1002760 [Lyophyllum shimeji]|uniref:Uncharacterized protein n=1 Tax=Lyophyllum shimeji TaxID=47721 RepID=A0A9P3PU06_LYOSH|nr:hypothetical protein LshimejAT787_1002760 [Lyophyllum shimeji]